MSSTIQISKVAEFEAGGRVFVGNELFVVTVASNDTAVTLRKANLWDRAKQYAWQAWWFLKRLYWRWKG